MRQYEHKKDREQELDRFLGAAEVEKYQPQHKGNFSDQFDAMHGCREKTEERVCAAGNRNSDGQHVIHNQSGTGNQAGPWTQQFRGDEIAAAARGKQLV